MSDENGEKRSFPNGLFYEKDGEQRMRPNYVCGGCFGGGVPIKEEFKDAATGKCTSCHGFGYIVGAAPHELPAPGNNV